jgi:hypothetical protein
MILTGEIELEDFDNEKDGVILYLNSKILKMKN